MALVAGACSGGPDTAGDPIEETTVLGAATGREVAPAPATPATTQPAPSPTPTTEEPEWIRETVAATPEPTPTPTPAPQPTPTPQTTKTAEDEPEVLFSGSGWSMNTLLPDDDGEGWTEVGGQPPIAADGTSGERVFAHLRHESAPGDEAGRHASCRAWVEAGGDALRVDGEVVLELLVGDDAVARSADYVELTLGPGMRHDLPAWHRSVRLHAAEGEAVTCTVWFFETGS